MVCFDLGLCCVRKYCSRKAYSQILTMLTTWQWDFKSFYHVLFFEDFFFAWVFFLFWFFLLFCYVLIFQMQSFRKIKTERKMLHLLVYFPNGCNIQEWTRIKFLPVGVTCGYMYSCTCYHVGT